mgnify:CR=1 FL=1
MREVKTQRKISSEQDRFLVTTSVEVGSEIRHIADEKGISYSKLIGDLVERHLDEVKNEDELEAEKELAEVHLDNGDTELEPELESNRKKEDA